MNDRPIPKGRVITAFSLPPNVMARLSDEAERLECSRSWIVAKAIDAYLAKAGDDTS